MLWSWNSGLVCLSVLFGSVHAGTLNIQDTNPGLVYSGSWYPDASPNAYGKHETWTNASGASVYYDFQGSEVQVFATLRPTGTYLTNVSFQIDAAAPEFWVSTANVPQETFNTLVYTSSPGTLAADGTHRITITNYGFVFWLVYLQITTPDVSGESSATTTTTASRTTTTTGTGTRTSSAETTNVGTSTAGTSGSSTRPSSASTTTSNSNTGTSSAGGASATSGTTTSGSASRTPVIIGAAVGSVGGAALLLAALWFWCMYSTSRRRALAPTPFDGEATEAPHLAKDRPPANPPSRFQRWMTGSQPAATEPGYGYPSTGTPENAPQDRAQSEPVDAEALKQLAVFRSAAEARAAPPAHPREPLDLRAARPPPVASIPSVLETPHPSTIPSASPRSAAPVSRSGALARAFSFSSPFSRDPARGPPSDATTTRTMSSALASSGVLPPPSPSPYVRQAPAPAPPRSHAAAGTRPVFFRVLRRSRDGGVRLAGGAPQELGAEMMMAPEEYERQILEAMSEGGSTLPPEYQQYPATTAAAAAGHGAEAGR